jgi:hypothetical protein
VDQASSAYCSKTGLQYCRSRWGEPPVVTVG